MFGSILVISTLIPPLRTVISPDLCDTVQFDFTQPQNALAAYRACVNLDEGKITQLHQRFLASWAKFAIDAGLRRAIAVLEDPQVREVLVSDEDWKWFVSCKSAAVPHYPTSPAFIAEIGLAVALTILTAIVAVWTLKLKSAVARGIPTIRMEPTLKEKPFAWEPERESLLNGCRDGN